MVDNDEILDLVDASDTVIGTIHRNEGTRLSPTGKQYIRSASVTIINEDGKFWFPVRSSQKSIAPGGYDNSADGHVTRGETYEACALRELEEECGIIATAEQLEVLAYTKLPNLPYYCKFFLLRTEQQPRLSNEHVAGEWLTLQEATDKIKLSGYRPKESVKYAISLLSNCTVSSPVSKDSSV